MIHTRFAGPLALAALLVSTVAGCRNGLDSPAEAEAAGQTASATLIRYNRDYVFVSPRGETPLVVPFTFRAVDQGSQLERWSRGWLARGGTWDRFLDESGVTSRAGGVWRVVPQGDLRITAGGPAELEALRFTRGERRLRLELDAPLGEWHQGGDTRFRLLSGRLALGAETISGPVLEILRVERSLDDGWPATQEFDKLFLTSGDSIQLLVAEGLTEDQTSAYAWTRMAGTERTWSAAEVRWLEMRPYQDARRELPRRWGFGIPAAGIQGEVEAAGFDALLGPERGGRRAVEARFTVEGWIEVYGERFPVVGMVRHTQL
jgi:hypothetical protein